MEASAHSVPGGFSSLLFLSRTSNPRLADVRLDGSRLSALVDGHPWTIVLPDEVLSSLDAGSKSFEALALRLVSFADELKRDFSTCHDISFT